MINQTNFFVQNGLSLDYKSLTDMQISSLDLTRPFVAVFGAGLCLDFYPRCCWTLTSWVSPAMWLRIRRKSIGNVGFWGFGMFIM